MGVHIVRRQEDVLPAMKEAVTHGTTVLVEEFIQGKELTVGILDGKALPSFISAPLRLLRPEQQIPVDEYGRRHGYICPADLPEETAAKVQEAALKAYKAAGVEVYGRVDVLLREEDGAPSCWKSTPFPA